MIGVYDPKNELETCVDYRRLKPHLWLESCSQTWIELGCGFVQKFVNRIFHIYFQVATITNEITKILNLSCNKDFLVSYLI